MDFRLLMRPNYIVGYRIKQALTWGLSLLALLFFETIARAQQARPNQYQVEAAYLYNFGKFISLAPDIASIKEDQFRICVIGKDPIDSVLDAVLAGETINGVPAIAQRIAKTDEVASCRILYISASEESRLDAILGTIGRTGVLTVSAIRDFSRRGGMIEFVREGNKIRFSIDLKPIADGGLSVSSDLLRVALTVRGNPPTRD